MEDGEYFIQNRHTDNQRYVTIDNDVADTIDGAIMELWSFTGANDQRWQITHVENGYYNITSKASDKNLLVNYGRETVNEAYIRQGTPSNLPGEIYNQQWRISLTQYGSYKIANRATIEAGSNLVMCMGQTLIENSDGVNVENRPYDDNTSYRDEWLLIAAIYGSKPYYDVSSTEPNCHGYAMMLNYTPKNWNTSATTYINNVILNHGWDSSKTYQNTLNQEYFSRTLINFENWLEDNGFNYQIEYDFSGNGENRELLMNQYRVVLRTGVFYDENGSYTGITGLIADYHFWYQTFDGRWANKHGATPSELLPEGVTPSSTNTSGWNVYNCPNFYNSDIYVYIITVS